MQKLVFVLAAFFWSPFVFGQQSAGVPDRTVPTIQIQTSRNVELLGFAYFLGYEGRQLENNDTYLQGRAIRKRDWYGYGLSLYRQYKTYENSKHLAVVVAFAENIWLDYLIQLLIQLDDFPNAKLKDEIRESAYLRFSAKRDPEEAIKIVALFIEAMNQLYREVDFDTYFRQNQNKYANALAQVKKGLPDKRFLPALEDFYGQRFDRYTLIPSLTIPTGMGFGVSYTLQDKTPIFHVFGPFGLQNFSNESNLDMGFDDRKHLLELSTHEFGHSFVNPAIDQLPQELINGTETLFIPIKSDMANQGYTRWKACLYEHFVRAGEIIIAQNLGNHADAQRLRTHYIEDRKFIYLPAIVEELESYNKTRTRSYQQVVETAMRKLLKTVPKKSTE